jgi:hypothetical protein
LLGAAKAACIKAPATIIESDAMCFMENLGLAATNEVTLPEGLSLARLNALHL